MEKLQSRTVVLVLAGLTCGWIISLVPLAVWAIVEFPRYRYMFDDELRTEVPPILAIPALAGGINGVIGAIDGLRSGRHRLGPVFVVPALLPIWPLLEYLRTPQNSDNWGFPLFAVIVFGGCSWISGRVGQRIGSINSRSLTDSSNRTVGNAPTRRLHLILVGVAFSIAISTIALCYVLPAKAHRFDTFAKLEDYVWSNGQWSIPMPPRIDWSPGTVVEVTEKVLGPKRETVQDAAITRFHSDDDTFVSQLKPRVVESGFEKFLAPATGQELKIHFAMLGVGNTTVDNSENVLVDLGNTQIYAVDLTDLQVALNRTVASVMGSKNLFVITEVLVSSQVQIRRLFEWQVGISMNEINPQFAARTRGNSKGHLIVSGPIVVGYKAMRIKTTGEPKQSIELVPMEREAQSELGKLRSPRGLSTP